MSRLSGLSFGSAAILMLLLAFGVSSCKREAPEAPVYEYRFAMADASTRAELDDRGMHWEAGDQVGLFLGSGTSVAAQVDVTTTPKTIVFSTAAPLPEGTRIQAYYPYQEGNTDVSAARVLFAHEQTQALMPMAGEPVQIQGEADGQAGVIYFRNLGAILDFRVYSATYAGEVVESISFRASAGGPVAGQAQVNLPESLALSWASEAGKPAVTLRHPAPVAASLEAASAGHLYMVLAPGTYSGILTVVTDAATYSFPFTDLTLQRNALKRVGLNLESANAVRRAVVNLENDRVKAFLDKLEANPYDPTDYSYTYMTDEFCGGINANNRLDWPRPVRVNWTGGASAVQVYNDAGMTQPELSVSVSGNASSADIYNLIPGRTYYYKVVSGNSEVASGAFKTSGRRRMMKVGDSPFDQNHAINCRDFGGQFTLSGQTLVYGKIFRGSNMDDTSDEAKDVLLHYMHVGLDVDLRYNKPNWGNERGAYLNDALGFGNMHTTETYNSWGELTDVNRMSATLGYIFNAVQNDIVVYIHCKVGADRTAYVCMLLEAILGVPQGWCDVDYEMTSFAGSAVNDNPRTRTGHGNYYYLSKTETNWWTHTTTTTVQGVDFINTFPGDTFQEQAIYYLTTGLGFSMETITAFQNKMLTPAP